MQSIASTMGRFHSSVFAGDEDQEEPFLDESNALCSLSPLQRIYAFGGCLVAGFLCMLLSLVAFARPIKFAILFTFGNLLAIGSTAFVIGVVKQARMMFDPVRIYATVIYIGSVVLALVCALSFHNRILTVLAIIIEICALIWYVSFPHAYVPFLIPFSRIQEYGQVLYAKGENLLVKPSKENKKAENARI